MTESRLPDFQVQAFARDGYLVVRRLFSQDQTALLLQIAKADRAMSAGSYGRKDASGAVSRLWLCDDLGDDYYSAIARTPRVVEPMQQFFGEPVVHFHHKMMQKEPYVGGAWEWHQDYGYWYRNEGFLYPDMASCLIAADRATRENGCLQVLKGSHLCGRIEHGDTGDQTGADMQRVSELEKDLELLYVELEPGDAVFFHGNTLHRSDQNRSAHPRWSFICCYATASNRAVSVKKTPRLTAIDPVNDDQLVQMGRDQWEQMQAAATA